MRKLMHILTVAFVLLTVVFYAVYFFTESIAAYSVFVTFFTFSYHFLMRLTVGFFTGFIPDKLLNPENKWFSPKKSEKKIYKVLKVKKWKGSVPAYYPDAFDVEKHSLKEISVTMCGAELTHEIIVLFSFVPVLFSLKFGVPVVFIITSVLAAMTDSVFIIVQRYNRPRILRLIKSNSAKAE